VGWDPPPQSRGRDPSLRARSRRPVPLHATSSAARPSGIQGRGVVEGHAPMRSVWGYMPFLHRSQQ
jgi:hypothetical protein